MPDEPLEERKKEVVEQLVEALKAGANQSRITPDEFAENEKDKPKW